MHRLLKKYPQQIDVGILIVGFTVGANYFALLRISGIREVGEDFLLADYGFHWAIPTLTGLFIGISLGLLEFRVFPRLLVNMPHGPKALLRLSMVSASIVASATLVLIISNWLFYGDSFAEALRQTEQFVFSSFFTTLFFFLMLLGLSLGFLRAVSNRFGPGILINYLLGKYQEPYEEERVFMFVDLNGSTRIAEQIGHVKYSRLLNKCFSDLSSLLPDYDAEIYQYVGDEAVVTWNLRYLKDRTRPVYLFFAFEALLQHHRSVFQEKFGVVPTFKASVHSGSVIVTELGTRRKELAYHGDVLNTGARVLELSSQRKKPLLVTDSLVPTLQADPQLVVHFVADMVLRGKNDQTSVYSVAPLSPVSLRIGTQQTSPVVFRR